ncbi:MAG: hypothetical protein K2J66_02385 [Muribaculaceae bacterium]|nr:hypothetical protein [Muribaculaceae bacterium]
MRKIIALPLTALMLTACATSKKTVPATASVSYGPEQTAIFTSTDQVLEQSFNWAKAKALSYAHDEGDPVGAWYEAALPDREAFCMRDVSHQTTGAQIIGLGKHNKNMMMKFAANISESRDWCTYWEINRHDLPAPIDYASDSAFWYCLNANGDVMMACLKMYEWTGDKDYISDPVMRNFYDRSVNEFIDRWQLQPESIMDREQIMNKPADFDPGYSFHSCRGLASYVENFGGLAVAVDLVGGLYAGHEAYAAIARLNGDRKGAEKAVRTAQAYRDLLETVWWDADNNRYNTFWTTGREFARGEGVPFLLWFDAVADRDRIRAGVSDILSKHDWNIENQSYFPALLYRLGYNEEAYRFLTTLPKADRADYPEVSYGVVEGIVAGAMGLRPSASTKSVSTLSRLGDDSAEIRNVPALGGYLSLRHEGSTTSEMENNTETDLTWHASFAGRHDTVTAGGKKYRTTVTEDVNGNVISTAEIKLPKSKKITARAD